MTWVFRPQHTSLVLVVDQPQGRVVALQPVEPWTDPLEPVDRGRVREMDPPPQVSPHRHGPTMHDAWRWNKCFTILATGLAENV